MSRRAVNGALLTFITVVTATTVLISCGGGSGDSGTSSSFTTTASSPPVTTIPPHKPTSVIASRKPTVKHTTSAPMVTKTMTTRCDLRSGNGTCYRAGEFCPSDDVGLRTTDATGQVIKCVSSSSRARWRHA